MLQVSSSERSNVESARPPLISVVAFFMRETRCTGFHGGEGGIRTLGTRKGSAVFKTAAFNHSATSPSPREVPYLPVLSANALAHRAVAVGHLLFVCSRAARPCRM